MICGYPWKGRSGNRWWKGVALVLSVVFFLFFLLSLF